MVTMILVICFIAVPLIAIAVCIESFILYGIGRHNNKITPGAVSKKRQNALLITALVSLAVVVVLVAVVVICVVLFFVALRHM